MKIAIKVDTLINMVNFSFFDRRLIDHAPDSDWLLGGETIFQAAVARYVISILVISILIFFRSKYARFS